MGEKKERGGKKNYIFPRLLLQNLGEGGIEDGTHEGAGTVFVRVGIKDRASRGKYAGHRDARVFDPCSVCVYYYVLSTDCVERILVSCQIIMLPLYTVKIFFFSLSLVSRIPYFEKVLKNTKYPELYRSTNFCVIEQPARKNFLF